MTEYKLVPHEPDHIPDAGKKVGRPQIRGVFMRNGARIEPGHDDLPDYVYESVFELMEMAAPAVQGEPEVRRYSMQAIGSLINPVQNGAGAWVAASDYEALHAECEKLRAVLKRYHSIVKAHAGASHMLDGFRPKRNAYDDLVDQVEEATRINEGAHDGQSNSHDQG